MKKSCSISHLFVVAGLVLAGNVCAMDNVKNQAVDFVATNKITLAAIAANTALPEDADAAKAATETMAFLADNQNIGMEVEAGIENFVLNYVVRKSVRCAEKNGYSLGAAFDKVAVLPAKAGTHVKPVVKGAAKAATPQMVAGSLVKILNRK